MHQYTGTAIIHIARFTFTDNNDYRYYRFNLNNNSGAILQLAEIELFGTASTASSSLSSSSSSSSSSTSSSSSSSSGACAGVPQYVNANTYATGAVVKNTNNRYRCNVGGWCTVGGPYAPGVGWAWTYAWTHLGSCQ